MGRVRGEHRNLVKASSRPWPILSSWHPGKPTSQCISDLLITCPWARPTVKFEAQRRLWGAYPSSLWGHLHRSEHRGGVCRDGLCWGCILRKVSWWRRRLPPSSWWGPSAAPASWADWYKQVCFSA